MRWYCSGERAIPSAVAVWEQIRFPVMHSHYPNGLILYSDLRQYSFLVSLLLFFSLLPCLLLLLLPFCMSSDPPSVILRTLYVFGVRHCFCLYSGPSISLVSPMLWIVGSGTWSLYSFTALLTHMPESFAAIKVDLKIQEGRRWCTVPPAVSGAGSSFLRQPYGCRRAASPVGGGVIMRAKIVY